MGVSDQCQDVSRRGRAKMETMKQPLMDITNNQVLVHGKHSAFRVEDYSKVMDGSSLKRAKKQKVSSMGIVLSEMAGAALHTRQKP